MLLAIIPAGTGVVQVEEFRRADDEAAALTAFCAEVPRVYAEADYDAIDTGWSNVQRPARGSRWSYDHDVKTLVETRVA